MPIKSRNFIGLLEIIGTGTLVIHRFSAKTGVEIKRITETEKNREPQNRRRAVPPGALPRSSSPERHPPDMPR